MPDPREKLKELIRRFITANGHAPDEVEFRQLAKAVDFPVPNRGLDVAKQAASGIAESGLTSVAGLGALAHDPQQAAEMKAQLPGFLQPAADVLDFPSKVIGGGLQALGEKLREALPQARTGLGRTARTVGRVAGDIGQFIAPGAWLAKAGKVLGTFRGAKVAQTVATGAPVGALLGAGDPEHSLTASVAEFTDSDALRELASTSRGAAIGDMLLDAIPAVGVLHVAPSVFRAINSSAKKVRTVWRASLTSQAATTVRNEVTRQLLTPFKAFEEGLTSTVQAVGRSIGQRFGIEVTEASTKGAMRPLVAIFGASGRKAKDAAIKTLKDAEKLGIADEGLTRDLLKTKTLEASAGEIQGIGLFARATRGYVNLISLMNRTMDMVGRRSSFIAAMERNASREGLDALDLSRRLEQAAQFPEQANRIISQSERAAIGRISKESTEEALANTFALSSKHFGPRGQKFLKLFEDYPALIFVHPFPRFLANSSKFLYDRSLGALRKIGSKDFTKSLLSGERESAKAVAQITEAFGAISVGLAVRTSCGGPKWYQCKIGEDSRGNPRYADLRPFAPLVIPLIVAEAIRGLLGEETQLTFGDYVDAFAGIRRLSGTALGMFAFAAEAKSADQLKAGINRYAQVLLGGLTIPAFITRYSSTFDNSFWIKLHILTGKWYSSSTSSILSLV